MFEAELHEIETPLATLTFDRNSTSSTRAYITNAADDLPADREVVRYPEQDLSFVGDAWANARILTLTGVLEADTPELYIPERQRIRGAINRLMRADGTLRWTPFGMVPVQMKVRRHEKPEISAKPESGGMLLSLIAADPRVYSQAVKTEDLLPSPNVGFTSPFVGPIKPLGTGADEAIANAGDTDSFPISRIYGPATNPVLMNLTTGEQIVFSGLTISDGDFVLIDHAGPYVWLNGSELASRYRYVDPSSTEFFAIAPGSNQLRLIASSTGANTRATVEWRDAWMP